MAIIKNVFRRKKKLTDADGNQESSGDEDDAFADVMKLQVSVCLFRKFYHS